MTEPEATEQHFYCPHCGHAIVIVQVWTPGNENDSGGYVLQCESCKNPMHYHLGRGMQASKVDSGAEILDCYKDELGNRDDVLKNFGLL